MVASRSSRQCHKASGKYPGRPRQVGLGPIHGGEDDAGYDGGMGLVVVIVGLTALSLLAVIAARWRRSGRPSRRRIALGVVAGALMIAAGLLLFPALWWAVAPTCCNP
jgi:hypothetical protein